jgi:hypothetical protein
MIFTSAGDGSVKEIALWLPAHVPGRWYLIVSFSPVYSIRLVANLWFLPVQETEVSGKKLSDWLHMRLGVDIL